VELYGCGRPEQAALTSAEWSDPSLNCIAATVGGQVLIRCLGCSECARQNIRCTHEEADDGIPHVVKIPGRMDGCVTSHHATPRHATSCNCTSHHVTSPCIASRGATSSHSVSRHALALDLTAPFRCHPTGSLLLRVEHLLCILLFDRCVFGFAEQHGAPVLVVVNLRALPPRVSRFASAKTTTTTRCGGRRKVAFACVCRTLSSERRRL
jgi:hypothetical protein